MTRRLWADLACCLIITWLLMLNSRLSMCLVADRSPGTCTTQYCFNTGHFPCKPWFPSWFSFCCCCCSRLFNPSCARSTWLLQQVCTGQMFCGHPAVNVKALILIFRWPLTCASSQDRPKLLNITCWHSNVWGYTFVFCLTGLLIQTY